VIFRPKTIVGCAAGSSTLETGPQGPVFMSDEHLVANFAINASRIGPPRVECACCTLFATIAILPRITTPREAPSPKSDVSR
jgi:hypothetical protein